MSVEASLVPASFDPEQPSSAPRRPVESLTIPRRLVACFWVTSMVISGVLGTIFVGFDLGASLTWLGLTLLGPGGVWVFVIATREEAPPRWISTGIGKLRSAARAWGPRPG